ncbi:MAG: ATP-binding cassette domain-containing protein [Treponema sp.]|nr:ATP-binding cassette domain-containing protein [Treponema sp.]
MVCLRCENLALGYESHVVVQNISCTVNAGDYLCIVGENGAGKTTLLKTLLGLQKPLAGAIAKGSDFNLQRIGYLPQQTVIQKDFPATVEEIVRSGCINRMKFAPFYRVQEKTRATRTMEQLGIAHLAKHSYRELSGGQQQRVLLARALCATQTMLFLDEPTAGLDPTATEDLYALIEQCNKDGLTVIMITHDMNAAVRYATHILHIGAQSFFGTKDEFIRSTRHE